LTFEASKPSLRYRPQYDFLAKKFRPRRRLGESNEETLERPWAWQR